jgi:hypothetical protein
MLSAEKHVELRYDLGVAVFDSTIFDYDSKFPFILV